MVKWTEEQHADYLRRRGIPGSPPVVDTSNPPFLPPANQPGYFALGRLPVGKMNRTEAAYDTYLRGQQQAGEILWFKFEALKLRLADSTFYTPDFMVLMPSREIEVREVKGYWQDDARVKIKVAASIYPFKFIAVTKRKGGWEREEF
jgi:hypothetical protein